MHIASLGTIILIPLKYLITITRGILTEDLRYILYINIRPSATCCNIYAAHAPSMESKTLAPVGRTSDSTRIKVLHFVDTAMVRRGEKYKNCHRCQWRPIPAAPLMASPRLQEGRPASALCALLSEKAECDRRVGRDGERTLVSQ